MMASYRLILCLIISLTSFGCDPASASQTGQVGIPTSEASQSTSETSLGSNSLSQSFQTNAIRHATRTANVNSPRNSEYLESIATGENKSKFKKDLFWAALIIFSMLFGAAIFAGLFYLVTNSNFEDEADESINAARDERTSFAEINPQTTTGNQKEESAVTAGQMGQNSAESSLHNLPHNLSAIGENSAESYAPNSAPNTQINQPDHRPYEAQKKRGYFQNFLGKKSADLPKLTEDIQPVNGSLNPQKHSANQPEHHGKTSGDQPLPNLPENRASLPPENPEIPAATYAATDTESRSLVINETTRLAKIDIIEELIKELQNPDPVKRRKSIWELSQQGDSRAIQPLVDLIIDSDSKQTSLILGALSEIGTRTLKPLNRALAISLQDRSPDVRKNAIRDLTRIYDLINQITQLLTHAVDDSDPEVQETARWALTQLSQLSKSSGYQSPSTLHPSLSPGDNYRE